MVEAHEKSCEFTSLKDFMSFSKQGGRVNLTVSLRKQLRPHIIPGETESAANGEDKYCFTACYFLTAGGVIRTITEMLVIGSLGESEAVSRDNRDVANRLLKGRYEQLRDADIEFEEKYF